MREQGDLKEEDELHRFVGRFFMHLKFGTRH